MLCIFCLAFFSLSIIVLRFIQVCSLIACFIYYQHVFCRTVCLKWFIQSSCGWNRAVSSCGLYKWSFYEHSWWAFVGTMCLFLLGICSGVERLDHTFNSLRNHPLVFKAVVPFYYYRWFWVNTGKFQLLPYGKAFDKRNNMRMKIFCHVPSARNSLSSRTNWASWVTVLGQTETLL